MSNNQYNLFLDDERNPPQVTWVNLPQVDWEIVRSYDEFVRIITQRGLPVNISFDHDLSDEHYQEYFRVRSTNFKDPINYQNLKEKTGFECAKWLAHYCVDNHLAIPQYYVHTMNDVGAENITSILESAKKVINII